MKSNTFNTAFIAMDCGDIESFLDVSFITLRRKVDDVIKSPGTYSIILDIVADPFEQVSVQEIKLEEVCMEKKASKDESKGMEKSTKKGKC